MRQTHQCPKCSATEVLHIPRVRDSQQGTICIHTEQGWVDNRLYGRLEAYVCGACGFTELYAVNPSEIPIDRIDGARRLGPVTPPPNPYR